MFISYKQSMRQAAETSEAAFASIAFCAWLSGQSNLGIKSSQLAQVTLAESHAQKAMEANAASEVSAACLILCL